MGLEVVARSLRLLVPKPVPVMLHAKVHFDKMLLFVGNLFSELGTSNAQRAQAQLHD